MGVETLSPPIKEISSAATPVVRSPNQISPAEISPKRLFSKEKTPLQLMEDEFKSRDIPILKPLQSVTVNEVDYRYPPDDPRRNRIVDITGVLEGQFDHLSKTKGLETKTPKTRVLQELVLDRLTDGTGIQTRVVIMNKGAEVEAFVTPDGSVFISQSLLNRLDNLDEVAGALAHEVSHLIFKTSAKAHEADSGAKRFGVGWVHEAACDAKAPELLEKAGFNTLAFATAIEKVSGAERGSIHQSGLTRASQSVGQHLAIDRQTSSTEVTPMPPILRGEVRKTNLEILDEILQREPDSKTERAKESLTGAWRKEYRAALELLNPKDLEQIYHEVYSKRWYRDESFPSIDICEDLIITRLQQNGYSRADSLFFLINNMPVMSRREGRLIKTVEEFSSIANEIESFENTDKFQRMHQLIFDRYTAGPRRPRDGSPADVFTKVLERYLYDVDIEKPKVGIPVTREALVNALEKINNINNTGFESDKARLITRVLASYINGSYLLMAADAGETVDIDQLKGLFQEFKDRGIKLEPRTIDGIFKGEHKVKHYGKDLLISAENVGIVRQAFNEVFEIQVEAERDVGFKEIDEFFEEFVKFNEGPWEQYPLKDQERVKQLRDFTRELRGYLDKNKFTDQQRVAYLEYITQKIDSANFKNRRSLLRYLEENDPYSRTEATADDEITNNLISRFNLKMIMAISLFEQDGPEFYSFLEQAMNNGGLDPNQLSRTQLINLCQGLFALDSEQHPGLYWYGHESIDSITAEEPVKLKDYDTLLKLPFMANIMEKDADLDFTNIKDLNAYIADQLKRTHVPVSVSRSRFDLFQESLIGLVAGRAARDNFYQILAAGIQEGEYADFYEFIDKYYPHGPQRDQFQREINKLYLGSPNVSIDEKTDYLVRFFDKVGPEGMVIVANEITDINTYRRFREKIGTRLNAYLEGSGLTTTVAFADVLTSTLVRNFDELLQSTTTDPKTRGQISTTLAKEWFEQAFYPDSSTGTTIPYDQGKFQLDEKRRVVFRTFNDLVETVKNFTPLQRFAIAHKALVDTRGALTSPKNREVLGKRLVESLGLGKGFVSSVLVAACLEADAKLIGFPASSMLGPLLFRAIDVNAVNLREVGKHHIYLGSGEGKNLNQMLSAEEMSHIMRANTRDITVFGLKYQAKPEALVAQLTQASDLRFHQVTDRLNALFNRAQSLETQTARASEIDPAIEAVIRGVETSGALGIRALQLATQFQSFPPALERRLSETFDSNPGLNKLLFWENIQKLGEEDPRIRTFLERITLGDYLGGGSLQTTYAATYRDESGEERQVILKMKNPNVEAFVREGYESAHKSLEVVARQRFAGKSREHARTGMVLMDLAQKWCLDDLNDKTFVEDDDQFRQTIAKFNTDVREDQFYAPERLFTSLKLKSEDLAPGKTVNQLLNDETIPVETKKQVVEMLAKFFVYQFRGNSFIDEAGQRYFLVHSDPHVGNYIADISGEKPKIGVIDRSLYLKLEETDVQVLEKLVTNGNNTEFADSFINRILDINKVRGVQRAVVRNVVFGKLAIEAAQQIARGGVNRFALMRTMLTELSNAKMDVPINLRLMIRNIGAFQELSRRYGLSLEQMN